MVENQVEEVQAATGGHHKANHRVMYLEKLNDSVLESIVHAIL